MKLENLPGLERISKEISTMLSTSPPLSIFLKGPSGRGKSSIARSLSEIPSCQQYCFLYLTGEDKRKDEAFYPLQQFIEKKDRRFNSKMKVVSETAEVIPYVGKGIKAILEEYDFRRVRLKKKIQDIFPFNRHVPFSIHLVSLTKKFEKVIVVCDNFDLLDDNTVAFLSSLRTGYEELHAGFNIYFLFISDQLAYNLDYNMFNLFGNKEITIPPFTKTEIRQILSFWTSQKFDDTAIDLITTCTGGHLSLLKIVANQVPQNLSTPDAKNFWHSIIDLRLKTLKEKYLKVKEVISAVGRAGDSISTYELYCLLDGREDCYELVESASALDIVELEDNYIRFTHPALQEVIASYTDTRTVSFYHKLSDCLKKISPEDYGRRAHNEMLGKRVEQANVYWLLAAIQKMREGNFSTAAKFTDQISQSTLGQNLRAASADFQEAYRSSLEGRSSESSDILQSMTNSLPLPILAEKDYLYCENLLKLISNQSKKEALEIIIRWDDFDNQEPEIWSRIMQLKIVITSESGEVSMAREIEGKILKYYAGRVTFDANARHVLDRLALFAEVIYTPEVAYKKMRQSEARVTQEFGRGNYHRGIDLYILRANLAGNSLFLGRFEDSIEYAKRAIDITEQLTHCYFPYSEVPLSNLLLAFYFSGRSPIAFVFSKYRTIHESTQLEENRLLIDINYAGLALMQQGPTEALQIMTSVPRAPMREDDDPFYFYYYWANTGLLYYLSGNAPQALEILSTIEPSTSQVSPLLQKYYQKHFEVLRLIVSSGNQRTYQDIAEFASRSYPLFSSELWNHFKRVYLFTDIQIWTSI